MNLINEAREWSRLWGVRLGALAGLVAGWLAANPSQTEALLDLLPEGPLRIFASAAIGLFVFAAATGVGTRDVRHERKSASEE